MSAKQFLKTLVKMVRKYYPKSREWTHEQVYNWVAWFAVNGRLRVINDGQNIVGVGMWRYLSEIDQYCDWIHNDEQGSIIWFDFIFSNRTSILNRLWKHARQGKEIKQLAYLRMKKNYKLTVLNMRGR